MLTALASFARKLKNHYTCSKKRTLRGTGKLPVRGNRVGEIGFPGQALLAVLLALPVDRSRRLVLTAAGGC